MANKTKAQIHLEICEKMHDTYVRKNKDYGDSFVKVREKYPNAILIRLNDKLLRAETLYATSERLVTDESVDDTLLDMANYCIMELIERRADVERQKQENGVVCAPTGNTP